MKTFFEDLTKKLGETAELVGNKANEAMEVQKLKNQIRTLERNNEDDLAEIGRIIYEKFRNGEELEAEEEALCEAIQDREESIEEYNEQIADLKGDTKCDICGKSIAKGMAYCPYCGEKVPTDVPTEADFVDEDEDIVTAVKEAAEEAEAVEEAVQEAVEEAVQEAVEEAEETAQDEAQESDTDAAEAIAEDLEDVLEAMSDTTEDVVEATKQVIADAAENMTESPEE